MSIKDKNWYTDKNTIRIFFHILLTSENQELQSSYRKIGTAVDVGKTSVADSIRKLVNCGYLQIESTRNGTKFYVKKSIIKEFKLAIDTQKTIAEQEKNIDFVTASAENVNKTNLEILINYYNLVKTAKMKPVKRAGSRVKSAVFHALHFYTVDQIKAVIDWYCMDEWQQTKAPHPPNFFTCCNIDKIRRVLKKC